MNAFTLEMMRELMAIFDTVDAGGAHHRTGNRRQRSCRFSRVDSPNDVARSWIFASDGSSPNR
jgi:hypothetical protein